MGLTSPPNNWAAEIINSISSLENVDRVEKLTCVPVKRYKTSVNQRANLDSTLSQTVEENRVNKWQGTLEMNIKLAHSKSLEYQLLPELREAYG